MGLILRYLVLDRASLSDVGNIFLFISSIVAVIYTVLNMLYVFKGRQDGSLMIPLSIFGAVQLLFTMIMRIIFIVRFYNLYLQVSYDGDIFLVFTMFGIFVIVSVMQVFFQVTLMR